MKRLNKPKPTSPALLSTLLLFLLGCSTEPLVLDCAGVQNGGTIEDECGICGGDGSTCLADIDGNFYQTVQIGDQLWMAENLKVIHYNNGDSISYPSDENFGSYNKGQYGVYDNDPANADIYGNLYNGAVISDEGGVCPTDFHVPSDEEFMELIEYLGGTDVAGGKMKETGYEHWNSPNIGATNESGFTGLPAGYRNSDDGSYSAMGRSGSFWTSFSLNNSTGLLVELRDLHSGVPEGYSSKQNGFPIRCLGD